MLREHRRFFLWATLVGLALRMFFFVYYPSVTDDSRGYIDLASNWLQHGVYGQTQPGQIVPTASRLPGYPAFLAGIFSMFGAGDIRAVLIAQIFLDLITCVVIADLARRTVSNRLAARVAFALTASCPFLANYATAVLTETLEVFFTAIALDCLVAGLDRIEDTDRQTGGLWLNWAGAGAAVAACILLRPDGGILLAAVGFYFVTVICKRWAGSRAGKRAKSDAPTSTIVAAGTMIAAIALVPLVPWTIRNLRTLHHFQPLAPRYANESEELAPIGFNRWVRTWMAEYASVEDTYWNVPGEKIDATKLPARALDEPGRDETLATIDAYNQSQELTPELDARFDALASERIRAHRLRYYVELPALRITDMWLRPRTELLPPDPRWWQFNDDPRESALAVAFGLVNLVYVVAAVIAVAMAVTRTRTMAVTRGRAELRYLGLLGAFVVLRSLFLGTLENPESRYTLECYPALLVWAAAFFGAKLGSRMSGRFQNL